MDTVHIKRRVTLKNKKCESHCYHNTCRWDFKKYGLKSHCHKSECVNPYKICCICDNVVELK